MDFCCQSKKDLSSIQRLRVLKNSHLILFLSHSQWERGKRKKEREGEKKERLPSGGYVSVAQGISWY